MQEIECNDGVERLDLNPVVSAKLAGADGASTLMIVIKNVARLIAVIADWVRDTVPITVNMNKARGGAAGIFADLGGEVEALSITNMILSPVSGLANWLASLLDDLS